MPTEIDVPLEPRTEPVQVLPTDTVASQEVPCVSEIRATGRNAVNGQIVGARFFLYDTCWNRNDAAAWRTRLAVIDDIRMQMAEAQRRAVPVEP